MPLGVKLGRFVFRIGDTVQGVRWRPKFAIWIVLFKPTKLGGTVIETVWDLKLENVLVGSDGHLKLSDFGLSKIGVFDCDRASSKCGTPQYMAPEMLKGLPYGRGVDWWALGIMVFEMLTGCPPYDYDTEDKSKGCDDDDDEKLFNRIMNVDVDYPDDMSLAALSLLMKLLRKNPAERLGADGSVDTMRRHPFFKWIDWNALEEKRLKPPEEEKESHYCVRDYMSGGTVWSKVFLEKLLSEEMARFYAAELTLAVEFLHKYGVGHRFAET